MTHSRLLALSMGFLFLLVLGDCLSTYLCLTTVSTEYRVWEYNQLSAWTFRTFGMVEGLFLFVVFKALGLTYLYYLSKWSVLYHKMTCVMVIIAILVTGYVNVNNWNIYHLLLTS